MFEELCRRQHGVVTRAQAQAHGITAKVIEGHVRAKRWQRVHRGVIATFSWPLPRTSQLWAAVLRAGPDAVLSHRSAAELGGLVDPPADKQEPIHVTVPGQRRPGPVSGLVIHRSVRVPASRHPGRTPPQTTIEETVLDLAELATTVDRAVGPNLTGS